MADRWWTPVDGVWTNVNNWAATRNGATGQTVPGSATITHIMDGDIDIAGAAGITSASIEIGGKFRGNIGGSGAALTIATAACVVTIESVAPNKSIAIGADPAVTLAAIHVKSTGTGSGTIASGAAGAVTLLNLGAVGRCVVDGSNAVATINNAGMYLSLQPNATAVTALTIEGGQGHDIQRSTTTFVLSNDATATGINSITHGTLNVASGATYTHDSDGTISTANIKPNGTLLPAATSFIVSASTLWEGGNISRNSNKITFTAPPVPIGNT